MASRRRSARIPYFLGAVILQRNFGRLSSTDHVLYLAHTRGGIVNPSEHWPQIGTNNPLERIMREIHRRTRVVGNFPDGNSALMLVAARPRHVAGSKWGTKKYMNADLLRELSLQEGIG